MIGNIWQTFVRLVQHTLGLDSDLMVSASNKDAGSVVSQFWYCMMKHRISSSALKRSGCDLQQMEEVSVSHTLGGKSMLRT